MNLPFISKIDIKQLTLTLNSDKATFSYKLAENQEKERQIVAGKILLKIAKQDWKVEGSTVTLTLQKEEIKNVALGEIKNLFEEMVN